MARYAVLGPDSLKGLADRAGLETKIQALTSLTARLDLLVAETRRMADDSHEGLQARRAVSSSDLACASATALPSAFLGVHRIVVEELACAHRIASDALPAARSVIPAGTYRFSVGAGDRMTALEVHVEHTDFDVDVVHAVAAAIDAAAAGVTTRIETGAGEHGDEYVRLHLTSRATGKRAALVTADHSRNLMVLLGLGASGRAGDRNGGTVSLASDAVFHVDGVRHTAPANRVYFEDRRLFLALHATGEATLAVRPDTAAVAGLMADWAQAMAGVLSLASQPSIRALLDPPADVVETLNALRTALASVGIQLRDGQPPQVLPDVVAQALEDDLEGFFARLASPDTGLAAVVIEAAQKEIGSCRRAIAALHRQAEWYRQVPSAQAARRLARQAVAAYSPSTLRVARTD